MASLRDRNTTLFSDDALLPSEVIPGLIASYRRKTPTEEELKVDCEWLSREITLYLQTSPVVEREGEVSFSWSPHGEGDDAPSILELEKVEDQLENGLEAVSELKSSICRAPFVIEDRRNEILLRLGDFQRELSRLLRRVESVCRERVMSAGREWNGAL